MSGSGPAGARGRGPRLAPNTPTRRKPWWSPSTAAGGDARWVATPTASSRPCGPRELGRTPIVVGDDVGIVGDLSGRPDTLARIVRRGERRTVLRRTADDTDPTERVVVANADQLLIVVALADPPPRTGLVERTLIAAYAGGLEPILCLTKTDLAPAGAVRRAVRRSRSDHHHCGPRRPARRRRAAAGRTRSRCCSAIPGSESRRW